MTHATELLALQLTIQPENNAAAPAVCEWENCSPGLITEVLWQFPTGSKGRVHVVLENEEGQIAPSNNKSMALGGGEPIPFRGLKIPIGRTGKLRIAGWVDDGASYPTTITVYVTVQPPGLI